MLKLLLKLSLFIYESLIKSSYKLLSSHKSSLFWLYTVLHVLTLLSSQFRADRNCKRLFFNNWKLFTIELHRCSLEVLLCSNLLNLFLLLLELLLLKLLLLLFLSKFFIPFDLLKQFTLLATFLTGKTLSHWLCEQLGRLNSLRLNILFYCHNGGSLEFSCLKYLLLFFLLQLLQLFGLFITTINCCEIERLHLC